MPESLIRPSRRHRSASADLLDTTDLDVLRHAIKHTSMRDIASALGIAPEEAAASVKRLDSFYARHLEQLRRKTESDRDLINFQVRVMDRVVNIQKCLARLA